MRRTSLVIALLSNACSAPDPLDAWTDAELCAPGEAAGAAVIPAPRILRQAMTRVPIPARARVSAGLELPALEQIEGGFTVQVLGDEGAQSIAERCEIALPEGNEEAYFLAIRGDAEAVIAAPHAHGRSRAAALLSQLDARPMFAADWPELALRGVLEGFYGPAWSFEERAEMLRFTWRARMNTLVWAPKGELLSRIFWRAGYDSALKQHLRDLARDARALEVLFCAEVSPGNGIAYGDAAERAVLIEKLDGLVALGVECLALAFDDISRALRPEDQARYPGGLGEAQADLVGHVFADLALRHPDVRLGFVPTDYSTRAMDEHPEYTRHLAAKLPRNVFVGWTGVEIVSPAVTADDVARATALWGRPPLMGDNYPVTDGARDSGRLQLGPVVGREAAAIVATEGWIANTLALPYASTIALLTVADQLWDPSRYDAEDAWLRATGLIGGESVDALRTIASCARGSALDPREAEELAALGEAWLARYPEASPALAAKLESMAGVAIQGPLARELEPWTEKLSAYGRVGLAIMDRPDEAQIAALRYEARALAASPVVICGGVMDELLARALAKIEAP